jgi:hypothetical protein
MAASSAAQAHPSARQAARNQVSYSDPALAPNSGIHEIKHIIVILQENRSFDNYFGTFPGAVGIPKGVCVPDRRHGGCRKPWVDHHDSNGNDPHSQVPDQADINGGKMNGFVNVAERMLCRPKPARCHPDVMGYHVVISPFAKHGYVDHQILSTDAYLKFIEDDFLGGARLNPHTDGRFDPRPDVREVAAKLGNLSFDFNFSRNHQRLLLKPCPATTLIPAPLPGCRDRIALHVASWGDS